MGYQCHSCGYSALDKFAVREYSKHYDIKFDIETCPSCGDELMYINPVFSPKKTMPKFNPAKITRLASGISVHEIRKSDLKSGKFD